MRFRRDDDEYETRQPWRLGRWSMASFRSDRVDLAIIGLVGFVVVVAGILAIAMFISSRSEAEPAPAASTDPTVTECTEGLWLDSAANACAPVAVCAAGEVYAATTNTCATPPLAVRSISPGSGAAIGGTEVTISGESFADGATVTIGGIPATEVLVVDGTTITALTPASDAQFPVDVIVANPDGTTGTLDNSFSFTGPAAQGLDQVSPAEGAAAGGERVIVTGTGFVDDARVTFFGRAATEVRVIDATRIIVTTPPGPLGPVNVTVRNGADSLSLEGGFTYVDAAPRRVLAVRPTKGPEAGGTKITITGSGFTQGARVLIGGVRARAVKVVSGTRITAVTPAGSVGPVVVTVKLRGVPVMTLTKPFRYVAAPTLASVRPVKGPLTGGTKVTITGTGFTDNATVAFDGKPARAVKVVNDTTITARTPTGALGPARVTVTNPGEPVAALPKGFTYIKKVAPKPEPTPDPAPGPKPGPSPTPKPTPTPTPTPPAVPRCRALTLPPVSAPAGTDLVLSSAVLFPASSGIQGARLTAASFDANTSNRVDGSILSQDSPPTIYWTAPDEAGRGGVITFSYSATSCKGTATGSTVRVSSS